MLRAAADILGRRPNATQDEIAKAVGVSRATLHRHFAGRGALFAALERLAVGQMREALDVAQLDEGSAADGLRRLVAACAPVAPYLALLYSRSQELDPELESAAWAAIDARIVELFRRGRQTGEFGPDLTPAWLTDAFYSIVVGAAWSIQAGRAAPRDFTDMVADLMLRGIVRS